MKTLTLAALFAYAEAVHLNVAMSDTPVSFPVRPYSPFTHDLFCRVFGHDPSYGPCPVGEKDSFTLAPYPYGYFDKYQIQTQPDTEVEEPETEEKEPEAEEEESSEDAVPNVGSGPAPEPDMEQTPQTNSAFGKSYTEERFNELYPFAGISFFDRDTHDGVHVVTKPAEYHESSAPEECDPVKELREELEAKDDQIAWLRKQLYNNRAYYYY